MSKPPTYKEKVVLAVVITFSILLGAGVMLVISLSARSGHQVVYYPDLTEQAGSRCWESYLFSRTYDPLYKWISNDVLPAAFSDNFQSLISFGVAFDLYQRASVWRVVSKTPASGQNGDMKMFNSPDPHLLGGVIHGRRTNWIWKMSVNWGVSVRQCLHSGSAQDACLITTPVVSSKRANLTEFWDLMITVPYRRPDTQYPSFGERGSYVQKGEYLTNFASNAKAKVSLGINRNPGRKSEEAGENWYYYHDGQKVQKCCKACPVNYTPDLLSYWGFPSYQCGCADGVCVVGAVLDTYGNSSGIFELETPGCQALKSFWDWDTVVQTGQGSKMDFGSYNSRWDVSLSVTVALLNTTLDSISDVDNLTLGRMGEMSVCVENWLEDQWQEDQLEHLKSTCTIVGALVLEPVRLERLQGQVAPALSLTFNAWSALRKLSYAEESKDADPRKTDNNITCGREDGQAALEDRICVKPLLDAELLHSSIRSFADVGDIDRFAQQAWKRGASERSELFIGIITAVLTLLVTAVGLGTQRLQSGERILISHMGRKSWLSWSRSKPGIKMIRTLVRTTMMLVATAPSLFSLYMSMKEIRSGRELATAVTVPQTIGVKKFLVTTTSTIEISANWTIFYALCSLAGIFTVVVVSVSVLVLKIEDALS